MPAAETGLSLRFYALSSLAVAGCGPYDRRLIFEMRALGSPALTMRDQSQYDGVLTHKWKGGGETLRLIHSMRDGRMVERGFPRLARTTKNLQGNSGCASPTILVVQQPAIASLAHWRPQRLSVSRRSYLIRQRWASNCSMPTPTQFIRRAAEAYVRYRFCSIHRPIRSAHSSSPSLRCVDGFPSAACALSEFSRTIADPAVDLNVPGDPRCATPCLNWHRPRGDLLPMVFAAHFEQLNSARGKDSRTISSFPTHRLGVRVVALPTNA